ncbi:MAG: UDP-N-acetylmuramoyl-tripeptide--D-alanyl-D-alanine ligase, partial [Rhodospirillales bacterium]|nr:UDP-N-acetylmuramoyl-tripeptide--D-alanyl-D-alanine ligase [Rhodospirillales bacterium]
MSALWTASALAAATGGRFTRRFDAAGVAIDTRGIAPGELFVALRGEHRDGHAFIAEALAAGAAGAMAERGEPDLPLLLVGDTLAGLTALGAAGRARFAGKVAAITGSVGKTTTKEMLRSILAAAGPTHAASASHNNHWGVPLTFARLPEAASFCVAELGMNHAGEIAPLARLARPHVAVITAIAPAHIGHLGSIEAIAEEKASILRGLEPGGVAVLPADSPHLPRLAAVAAEVGARIVTFGESASAAFRLLATEVSDAATALEAESEGARVTLRLAAPGRHMALNALAALAAAAALGIPPARGAAALAGFAPLAG